MTKKKRLAALVALGILLVALLAVGGFFFFGRGGSSLPAPDLHHYKALRTLSVALMLAEKPDAVSVCLADEGVAPFREDFCATGLSVTNTTCKGRNSIVLFSRTPKDWSRLTAHVADAGILVRFIDANNLKKADFKSILMDFPFKYFHLWMPGEFDWLVIGRAKPSKLKLDALFDLFANEKLFDILAEAGLSDPADIFSNYVGTWADLKDAFAGDNSAGVLPENFVTYTTPQLPWLFQGGVEADILREFQHEARSRQVVRRLVLKGAIAARQGDENSALDAWSAAWKRNPNDSMLLERLYRLAVNARAFMKIGNIRGAAKCYETMIAIRPTDIPVLKAYAECLLALGQRPLAEKVLEHVRILSNPARKANKPY